VEAGGRARGGDVKGIMLGGAPKKSGMFTATLARFLVDFFINIRIFLH
jgi:hypothetical protein